MMLKERDKKLLFYSWSYAILASALIYACCGYGALAYTQLWSGNNDAATHETEEYIRSFIINASDYNNYGITHLEWTGNCKAPTAPYSKIFEICSESVNRGNVTVSVDCPTASFGEGSVTIDFDQSNTINTQTGEHVYYVSTYGSCISYFGTDDFMIANESDAVTEFYRVTNGWVLMGQSGIHKGKDLYKTFSGTEAPDAPIINDFTKDATCYSPGEAIVLESNVTGTVDSWLWEIYDSDDVSVWSSTDSVETIVDENFDIGMYQVQLYVENTGGNDFLSKDNWLNITQAGTCTPMNNWTNPFPTQVTTIPTQQFYETMTMPPHIVTNMTGINDEINKGLFANMSQGYRDYIDYVGEQANTTFTDTFRTLLSPVTLVVNSIAGAIGLFSTAINSLTVYTTVPLAITAIVINYMPWQIVTLITAGIAIDAILIIILGR